MASETNERLLEAATSVFLERGFEGATFEQIAEAAHCGKATIYARFSGKDALFSAVMKSTLDRSLRLMAEAPLDVPLEQRLSLAGEYILGRSLIPQVVALMRVVIGGAPRFPVLARLADELGRQRAIGAVTCLIMGRPLDTQFATEDTNYIRALDLARQFLDLVFAPLLMRALMGADLEVLKSEISSRIAYSINMLKNSGALYL